MTPLGVVAVLLLVSVLLAALAWVPDSAHREARSRNQARPRGWRR